MENALEIEGLNKSFDDFSISNLSFFLPTGSIMGFIGENGAGKSTTIKLMLGLLKQDSGDIRIFGKNNLSHGIDIKEDVGIAFNIRPPPPQVHSMLVALSGPPDQTTPHPSDSLCFELVDDGQRIR